MFMLSIKSNTLGFRSNKSNQMSRQTIYPPPVLLIISRPFSVTVPLSITSCFGARPQLWASWWNMYCWMDTGCPWLTWCNQVSPIGHHHPCSITVPSSITSCMGARPHLWAQWWNMDGWMDAGCLRQTGCNQVSTIDHHQALLHHCPSIHHLLFWSQATALGLVIEHGLIDGCWVSMTDLM